MHALGEETLKVFLAIPPYDWQATHDQSKAGTVTGAFPPVGLLIIAAALREAGHTVRVMDGVFHTEAELAGEIERFMPDILGVGFAVNLWPQADALARKVRVRVPRAYFVAGGPGPSVLGARCLEEGSAFHAVVLQEGEISAVELARRLEGGESPAGIRGIVWKDADGGIHTEGQRPPVLDLDTLPLPAFDLVDVHRYVPKVGSYRLLPCLPVESSRGCSYDCIFCYKLHGRQVRFRSPESSVAEITRYVSDYGAREVSFNDEHFLLKRERVEHFCRRMRDADLNVLWSVAGRVDSVDRELLHQMKRAGCWYVYFGLESGVQKNLDMLGKRINLDQARQAIRWCRQEGLVTMALFVLGIPGETVSEARQTIRFARRLNSHYASFFPLTPFPGTKLAEIAEQFGTVDPDIGKYNMHTITFVPNTMKTGDLERLLRWAYLSYCLRPRFVWLRLTLLKSPEDFRVLLRGLRFVARLSVEWIRQRRTRSGGSGVSTPRNEAQKAGGPWS